MLFSLAIVHILPEAVEAHATYLAEQKKEDGEDAHDHRRLFARVVMRFLSRDDNGEEA